CCVSTLDSIVGVSSTEVGTVIEGVLTGAEVSEVVTAVEVAVLGDSHPLEFCQFSLGSTVMTLNSDSKSSAPNNREVLMRTVRQTTGSSATDLGSNQCGRSLGESDLVLLFLPVLRWRVLVPAHRNQVPSLDCLH